MNYIEEYYSNYDEEGRLLSRHGQVDAVELTEHNLSILRSKLTGREKQTAIQGNALDLSAYEDNTFDMTLVLGPMYHLYNEADRIQALQEAVRVTKPGGFILIAYCMNDSVVIQESFVYDGIKKHMETKMLTEDFHCLSAPADLFAMVRIEEIHKYAETLPVTRLKTLATDGATNYLRSTVDTMDDETFAYWVKYHLCTCERQDLIEASNHSLDIIQKSHAS